MNVDLGKLIRLQRSENELGKVEADLGETPGKKAALESHLANERARLESVREALETCQRNRRRHEGDLQDLETRRSRYKEQLMAVKTNKEYTAMLHEIETVEREIREREDQILEEMEQGETLTLEVKTEEVRFKEVEERHRVEVQALAERTKTLEVELKRVTAERDEVAAELPADLLERFRRVAHLRGAAVAEAKDGTCQLCNMKLRPQMYVDVKRNDEIIQCPSCSRVLFYEPPVPVVAPPEP